MVVADIIDDAKDIFAQCEGSRLYDRITEAVELLANEAPVWDAMTDGVITLNIGSDAEGFGEAGIVVLPAFVETPVGVNLDGFPAFPRDRWFQFHINGPGNHTQLGSYRDMWDDRGDTPVLAHPVDTETLVLTTDDASDSGAQITVFGTDDNDAEIFTNGKRGVPFDVGTVSPVKIKKILDISKPKSNGTWTLKGNTSGTLLGVYAPSDTCPRFRKIKVPQGITATIRYRRTTVKVEQSTDIIPLNNKLSLKLAMQAANFYNTRRYDEAKAAKEEAIQLASREQQTRNAQSPIGPQIQDFTMNNGESLWRSSGQGRGCGNGILGG